MSVDTISKLLEQHDRLHGQHAKLHATVEKPGCLSGEEVSALKVQKYQKKTAMQVVASKLAKFPVAELRQELSQLTSQLNICSVGGRHATSADKRERLERDIALIEEAIPEAEAVRLVYRGNPPASVSPADTSTEQMAATG